MPATSFLQDKKFLGFLFKFLGLFAFFYLVCKAVIGLSAPGNYYVPFVQDHLDFISGIKNTLILGSKFLLSLFGVNTVKEPNYALRIPGGRAIIVSMSCVGYAVYSFWLAYCLAGHKVLKSKLLWAIGGLFLLWLINTCRIAGYLYVINQGQNMPLGIDHHTWFNIFAYLAIFVMIFFYERTVSLGREEISFFRHEATKTRSQDAKTQSEK